VAGNIARYISFRNIGSLQIYKSPNLAVKYSTDNPAKRYHRYKQYLASEFVSRFAQSVW